ncbi:MAG: sugar transferase [Clostridia bacterium]|nr:sugar transferase [Clostridia bacterium]
MENINEMDATVKTESKHRRMYDVPEVEVSEKPLYNFIKRFFDIILSLIGLAFCIVPMLIIAIIIKCDSPGPAVYKQERLGKGGKSFLLYKFRSMRMDAEEDGAKWAEENDERCTRVGKFLRKSRIDELPQLINILVGSMSLVGPRPERPCFYNQFEEYIHGFSKRLLVKPGLTGWAQVNGGYDLLPEEKIVYDIEYIKMRSLWLDVKCIVRTVAVVFNHDGAR